MARRATAMSTAASLAGGGVGLTQQQAQMWAQRVSVMPTLGSIGRRASLTPEMDDLLMDASDASFDGDDSEDTPPTPRRGKNARLFARDDKKVAHSAMERRYRQELNGYINDLRILVPFCTAATTALNKVEVLQMTAQYIRKCEYRQQLRDMHGIPPPHELQGRIVQQEARIAQLQKAIAERQSLLDALAAQTGADLSMMEQSLISQDLAYPQRNLFRQNSEPASATAAAPAQPAGNAPMITDDPNMGYFWTDIKAEAEEFPSYAHMGQPESHSGAHDFLVDATVGSDLSMNPLDFADLMWKDGQRGRPRSLSN